MTNYTTNLKDWGDVGQEYPDGYSYADGEPPVDEWDDFFNYNVEADLAHLRNLTNERIDSSRSDSTSLPSNPTPGHAVWQSDERRFAVYDDTAGAFKNLAYQNEFDAHQHDGRYYTETELDSMLGGKSDTTHLHDDRYYTETQADSRFLNVSGDSMSGRLTVNGDSIVGASYASENDIPTGLPEGAFVSVGGALYVEDGT